MDSAPFKAPKILKDKSDRKTVQKVLDPKTRKILERLEENNKLYSLQGCISTGKEANVYTAIVLPQMETKFIQISEDKPIHAAIKIYQTSIMEFKNRERYITSETRFQTFCKSNPRKLVKVWAEKEVRNLKRLNKTGIPSPFPIYLKNNILIMSLIGTQDNVAKRLKEAEIEDYDILYEECINLMYRMYNEANLIHSDLSEYNLLYHNKTIYVIDLGQAVEKNHQFSNSFLISDIKNINNFFRRKNVETLKINEIFEKITKIKIPVIFNETEITNEIFIPQTIDEVNNFEDAKHFFKTEENKEVFIPKIKIEKLSKELEKLKLKENKVLVKEQNRIRRANRISEKERNKLKQNKKKQKEKSEIINNIKPIEE